ncbi:hypothetical protein AX17_006570 [Amanita inopinata Kibby_2008]|nr:hypothetical protein AX17_006570 [Amanita inopinata Kibby_2008]
MAETLSAVVLVTSSAKGNSLVFWWPPYPTSSPRLCRARAPDVSWPSFLDNPWRASHPTDSSTMKPEDTSIVDASEYQWSRPSIMQHRHPSDHDTHHHSPSGRNTPSKDRAFGPEHSVTNEHYDMLFGYSSEYLANLLCPQPPMCHQRFELIVDNLAFLGHPVCADADGTWKFKLEKTSSNSRGRESRDSRSPRKQESEASASPDRFSQIEKGSACTWLQTFHLVFILDMPEPSSSASGNVSRYFDIIYEQIAFVITAVLFQEQVLSNFVEAECDILGTLKDSCISKGEPFAYYCTRALEQSSIAPAMRVLYEAIKLSSMAYITIHDIPMELQLPPYLDQLLHNQEEDGIDFLPSPDDDETLNWEREMNDGWRLPSLAPWKSLLLLDGPESFEPYFHSGGTQILPQDRPLAEGLMRFLKTVNITLSLADVASLLDWDLESQIYPTVRWLVQHRWAKVVDVVHPGLKTIFTLPPKFSQPLSELVADFGSQFSHSSIPSLPNILAAIPKTDNHFFAAVVKSKELIPIYYDIVHWLLKRDMLITLHLRIRLVATRELKIRARQQRQEALLRKGSWVKGSKSNSYHRLEELDLDTTYMTTQSASGFPWLSPSSKHARRYTRRLSSTETGKGLAEVIQEYDDRIGNRPSDHAVFDEEDEDGNSSLDGAESGWESSEDSLAPTMIEDPGRATPIQRRWLSAMSEGKEPHIARRFALINQYFDGKKTNDEILYRAEISRKQLREVIHHYQEYIQTFLHPS